jgi:CheY-like chemotaxis protein
MARIMVVEDNPDNVKLFKALLAMKGHQVEWLPSGEGMLELIARWNPELVLMDIQLPGRDGFALLQEIRAAGHKDLRVVALTAHAMSGDRQKAREVGFNDYITKPIEIGAFPGQIVRALAGEPIESGDAA